MLLREPGSTAARVLELLGAEPARIERAVANRIRLAKKRELDELRRVQRVCRASPCMQVGCPRVQLSPISRSAPRKQNAATKVSGPLVLTDLAGDSFPMWGRFEYDSHILLSHWLKKVNSSESVRVTERWTE